MPHDVFTIRIHLPERDLGNKIIVDINIESAASQIYEAAIETDVIGPCPRQVLLLVIRKDFLDLPTFSARTNNPLRSTPDKVCGRSSDPVRVGRKGAYAVAPVRLGPRGTWHFISQDVDKLARVGRYEIAVIPRTSG